MNTLIATGALGVLVLLLEIFGARKTIIPITIVGLLVILGISLGGLCTESGPASFFNNTIVEDNYSIGFSSLFILLTVFIVLMSADFYVKEPRKLSDYITVKIILLFGAIAMVSFGNLATYFVGIEILSISLYVLASSRPTDVKSNEAGMKYFLMGAFASGFLLFGIALIYGATGSFNTQVIREQLAMANIPSWFYIGMTMICIVMFFKMALAPFHLWAPDVYQGSPALVTALMSTLAKVVAIGGFYRIVMELNPSFVQQFDDVLVFVAILSMTVGNIMALRQKNVKRMLAYSGISHAGFMLMALLAVQQNEASNLLYYATAYSIAGIAAFATIIAVSKNADSENISSFDGLSKRNPLMALTLTLALLSMAGIPVLAGFFAKVLLFGQMLELGYFTLVIFAVINSIISIGYYFKLILKMYTKKPAEESTISIPFVYTVVAVVATILNITIGLFPDVVLKLM
ncbi:MAG: NADH-quinone oxidoreductase subunit N [Bacteroidota bacterium]|nr:NADH-quinone oxidoreductase subunit N [Bacteroidota bacterium]